jgi:hypothetical protein
VDDGLRHALLDTIAVRLVFKRGHRNHFQPRWQRRSRAHRMVTAGAQKRRQTDTEAQRKERQLRHSNIEIPDLKFEI